MSLKRKNKPTAEPMLDGSNKRFSTYSFSELKIPAMPVIETDYEAEVEHKLTELTLGNSSKTDGASCAMEAALENCGMTVDSCNYVGRGELLCERLETVPEFKIPAPPKLTIPKSTSLQECLSRPAPVPSAAGVLPPPPSVTQQRLYRRSLSAALPHYCSLERRPRPGQRPQVWMVRSQSFTDVCDPAGQRAGQQEDGGVIDSVGRPPLRGGGRMDDRERRNSIRKSMRAISGSWRNLLKQVGGMNRPQKPAVIRKVAPPQVPELSTNRHSGGSFSSGYGSFGQPDSRSSCGDDPLLPPPSPLDLPPSPGHESLGSSMYTGSSRLSGSSSGHSPGAATAYTSFSFPTAQPPRAGAPVPGAAPAVPSASGKEFVPHFHNHLYQHQHSDDQGIDVQSPGRDSPSSAGSSSSFGCRNSTSSLDSGRASSAYDSKISHPPSLNRLSGQSYESGGSYRQSYHSSSSSLGSLEKDDAISHLNVAAMLADGMKDSEVLNAWLTDFHFEEYYQLFVSAGYDMPTVSRMTPEDLTAIGITKPAHRRKLKSEIARLNISDALPDFIPESLERWLHLLRLGDYTELLRSQGYTTVQQATEITWEDLEEIGISRLGHQKKITLAIKRAKDILTGKRVPSQYQHQYTTQEIAITGSSNPAEPTYQQFKTFHHAGVPPHPPVSLGQPGWGDPGAAAAAGRFQGFSQYRPLPLQQVQVQVEPSAAEAGNEPPPPPAPQTQMQYFEQQRYILQPWRRSFEDGDLTPTNETQQGGHVDSAGAGTLPRPRAQARPRPVAKIVAKTREEPADTTVEADPPPKGYGSLPRDPLKRAEQLSRPPPFSTPQSTPKKPVPAPPRRDSLRAAEAAQLAAARQAFPPPPLPLVVRDAGDTSDTSDCESSSPATVRPGRTDSAASFKSTSSTESDSFPFANDNAGTIKQRAQRPPAAGELTSSLSAKPGKPAAGAAQGDVLNDIGSMLADLTDELDAMLELETDVK